MLSSLASGMPWSGGERNHVYFGGFPGQQFEDLSGVTGLDDPGDGRSFALLDFDRDGWLDIALANTSAPRLRLLRNGIGNRTGSPNRFVAIRFVGGNKQAAPSKEWSARDGFGSAVELDLGDGTTLFREHQPESGYLGQHSSTMIIGLGQKDSVASLRVRWLSGKLETATQVPAGMLITVYENPADSPTGESFTMEPYRKAPSAQMTRLSSDDSWKSRLLPKKPRSSNLVLRHDGKRVHSERGLTLVTTMATWCAACVTEMPELNALRAAFTEDELAMIAVPVDGEDTADKLKRWAEKYEPPYQLLTGIAKAQVDKVNRVILRELRTEAVPATFLTDSTGQVLIARWGVPSISAVRRWLWLTQSNKEHLLARKGP